MYVLLVWVYHVPHFSLWTYLGRASDSALMWIHSSSMLFPCSSCFHSCFRFVSISVSFPFPVPFPFRVRLRFVSVSFPCRFRLHVHIVSIPFPLLSRSWFRFCVVSVIIHHHTDMATKSARNGSPAKNSQRIRLTNTRPWAEIRLKRTGGMTGRPYRFNTI